MKVWPSAKRVTLACRFVLWFRRIDFSPSRIKVGAWARRALTRFPSLFFFDFLPSELGPLQCEASGVSYWLAVPVVFVLRLNRDFSNGLVIVRLIQFAFELDNSHRSPFVILLLSFGLLFGLQSSGAEDLISR